MKILKHPFLPVPKPATYKQLRIFLANRPRTSSACTNRITAALEQGWVAVNGGPESSFALNRMVKKAISMVLMRYCNKWGALVAFTYYLQLDDPAFLSEGTLAGGGFGR